MLGVNLSFKNFLNSFLASSLLYPSTNEHISAIIFFVFLKNTLPSLSVSKYQAFTLNSSKDFFIFVISLLGSHKSPIISDTDNPKRACGTSAKDDTNINFATSCTTVVL